MNRLHFLVRNLFRTRKVEQDLQEELRSCMELLVEEKMASGMSEAAARRAARVEFGCMESVRDEVRSATAGSLMRALMQDLHYAARTLRRQPGLISVAVLTIALGVGLNASIFSIFSSILLRPVPGSGSTALVSLYQTVRGQANRAMFGGQYRFSYPEYLAYRDANHVVTGLAAYHPETRVFLEGRTEELEGQIASCNYFAVLEAPMALGRGFSEAECDSHNPVQVVVLSNDVWRNQFASDAGIVGRTIRMNRVPMTVVGVAAAGFQGTDVVSAGFWLPLPMMQRLGGAPTELDFSSGQVSWLELVGRRRPGVSIGEVRADFAVLAGNLDKQHPGQHTEISAATTSLIGAPNRRQAVMGAGAVVLIAVAMVLMIACANLANLMLARSLARGREIAMRLSLGASRGRIVRQLLTEALLISAAGGTLGILIALWSGKALFHVLLTHLPAGAPAVQLAVSPDLRMIAYGLVLTVIAGAAFGLAPALQASRTSLHAILKQESAGVDLGVTRLARRGWLIGAQVAVCMVLLLVSGLLLRALERAQSVDPGFAMQNVATVSWDLASIGLGHAQASEFNTAILDRVRTAPRVSAAVLASGSPLGSRHFGSMFAASRTAPAQGLFYLEVSPGFFSLLDIPLLRGRDFTSGEIASNIREVIVSDSLARSFWPGEDPLGKFLHVASPSADLQVIGVAKDAEVSELGAADHRFVYLPPDPADAWLMQTVLVRYEGDYSAAAATLRNAGRSFNSSLKVDVAPLEENLAPYRAISRLTAGAAGTLAIVALGLAIIGLYGTVAYGVSRRTREIGLRIALGAERGHVLRLLISQAMRPVIIGALVGIALCASISRILSGILFGVSPHDAITFAGVPLLLAGIALLAAYLPAQRALRVDPVVALREN